jgi:hypothetical protein
VQSSVLVFEYDEFPPVPDDEWQGSHLKHAVVLATVLAGHLRQDDRFAPQEPVQEDFGAVLPVVVPEGEVDITIGLHPRGTSDFTWALQFTRYRPLLRRLLAKSDDAPVVGPVKQSIAELVANEPTRYRNPEWIEESEL